MDHRDRQCYVLSAQRRRALFFAFFLGFPSTVLLRNGQVRTSTPRVDIPSMGSHLFRTCPPGTPKNFTVEGTYGTRDTCTSALWIGRSVVSIEFFYYFVGSSIHRCQLLEEAAVYNLAGLLL